MVGDPAQTIYSFAGASSYSLLNFASEFGPLTADINLNNDYRSTPQIVNYANRVLAASPQRADYLKLSSERSKGRRVTETIYGSDWEEARGVAARIRKLVDAGESPGRLRDSHQSQRTAENPVQGIGRTASEIPRAQG